MDHRRKQVLANAAFAADQNDGTRSGDLARVLKQLQRLWLNRDPHGKRLRFGGFGLHNATEVTSSCAPLQLSSSVRLSCVRESYESYAPQRASSPRPRVLLCPPAAAQGAPSPPTSTGAPDRNICVTAH